MLFHTADASAGSAVHRKATRPTKRRAQAAQVYRQASKLGWLLLLFIFILAVSDREAGCLFSRLLFVLLTSLHEGRGAAKHPTYAFTPLLQVPKTSSMQHKARHVSRLFVLPPTLLEYDPDFFSFVV
jgi:hypothetical protein